MKRFFLCLSLLGVCFALEAHSFFDLESYTKSYQQKLEKEGLDEDDVKGLEALLPFNGDKNFEFQGFLYQNASGQWLLAPQPNLKSCCIKSKKKVLQQVYVEANATSTDHINQLVKVRGEFLVEPKRNEEGHYKQLFVIKNAHLVPVEKNRNWLKWAFWLAVAGLVAYYLFKK